MVPHLIGVDAAVDIIATAPLSSGRLRSAAQAVEAGIADEVIGSGDFQFDAIAWVDDVLAEQRTVLRRVVDDDENTWQAAVESGIAVADARVKGAAPAAYRALDLLAKARTADRHAAYTGEDQALTDLVFTGEAQAAMYAAGLRRRAAKRAGDRRPATAARDVGRVGVVGAGLMASQLAVLFATELKVSVVMRDVDRDRADRGLARVDATLATEQRRGRLSEDQARRIRADISASDKFSALAESDLVIEAVFEDSAVKQRMLAELEPLLSPTCVIATNTSSLSLHEMAHALQRPERFVGMHFFNPVLRMPLLEIVEAIDTDAATVGTALEVGLALGKCCVTVRDRPGFVVNRLLTRMFVELLCCVDEGTSPSVADAALDGLGLPMSPFALLELIGPAVQLHINETLADTWPDRFPVSPNLRRLVAAGLRGFLDTTSSRAGSLEIPVEVMAILQQGNDPSSALTVHDRVRQALADEARLLLREQVVPSAQDIDTCMLLGAGWPAHLGGLTPWLDRSVSAGDGDRFLAPGVASLPNS